MGMFRKFLHEFVIFGLRSEVAHQVLNIAVEAVQAGRPIDLAEPTDDLLEGYPCCFVMVPESEYSEHLGFARFVLQFSGCGPEPERAGVDDRQALRDKRKPLGGRHLANAASLSLSDLQLLHHRPGLGHRRATGPEPRRPTFFPCSASRLQHCCLSHNRRPVFLHRLQENF